MKKVITIASLLFLTTTSIYANQMDMNEMKDHKMHKHNMMNHDKKVFSQEEKEEAKKGKKIFKTMCDENSFKEFKSKDLANEYLKNNTNICKNLSEDRSNLVAFYLANAGAANDKSEVIEVPEDAKCPVCGMFVAKFAKWASSIKVGDKYFYFDGVKDMMKFYFESTKYHKDVVVDENSTVSVTDYYTLEALNAKDAFYVIGSNVYGPMGEELIPFKNETQASKFKDDHMGKSVIKFDEIKLENLQSKK